MALSIKIRFMCSSFPHCRIAEGGVGGNFRENGNLGGKDELINYPIQQARYSVA